MKSSRSRQQWLVVLGLTAVAAVIVGQSVLEERSRWTFQARRDSGAVGSVETGDDLTSTTVTTLSLSARRYSPGDCVTWDQGPDEPLWGRATEVVPCAEPHLTDITGSIQLGAFDPYPGDEGWGEVLSEGRCLEIAEKYLGSRLDPYGRFGAGGIHPSAQGWGQGQRTVWCGLQRRTESPEASDHLLAFEGRVKGQDQARRFPQGACLVLNAEGRIGGEGPCSEPHMFEVTGTVEATGGPTAPPPTTDQQTERLTPKCDVLAEDFLGGRLPSGVSASTMTIEAESWETGKRRTECLLGRFDRAGNPQVLDEPLRRAG